MHYSSSQYRLYAQIPEDVLKYSWQPTNGTARINAVGGAMGSLGGDISATFINPAGLGFFKTSEIVAFARLFLFEKQKQFSRYQCQRQRFLF